MENWTDFKKTFTQKQEDALWQYFIDHSRIQPNGYFGIMFYIRNIDDFWERVYSRYTGDFTRYDILKREATSQKYQALASQARKGTIWDKRNQHINKHKWLKYIWNKIIKYVDKKINEENRVQNKAEKTS